MAKNATEGPKKMRQVMALLAREIPYDSVFESFEDLAMTESEMLKLRRGVERILRSKLSDYEWDRVKHPLDLIGLVNRKMHGTPRR